MFILNFFLINRPIPFYVIYKQLNQEYEGSDISQIILFFSLPELHLRRNFNVPLKGYTVLCDTNKVLRPFIQAAYSCFNPDFRV